ncbi:prolactin-inducible protein [Tenrec ecaudatus]|uniref:prolactin-inducible protein n=1 Tax=Tenrec ecaudatus TaxID=94439 RepID=UPI003F59A353
MRTRLLQSWAGPAALLLVLILQLGPNNAQESGDWKVMDIDLKMQQTAKQNETVPVSIRVTSYMEECMVIKAYLKSFWPLGGYSSDYKFTVCVCKDYPRSIFWEIEANRTVEVYAVVDIVRQMNICPGNKAVIPITANRFYKSQQLNIE